MTDITELAQRVKTEASAIDDTQWYLAKPSEIRSLLEALEKAQAQSSKWLEAYHKAVSVGARYEERIAELESRTVTVKQYDEFQICHYGTTEDYAKGYIDCQNNFFKWLTAAGIKWEAE
ncbi:hypothetical protein [Klebsiella grimontii]|uniref:Ead/Ea22-like family protein n=1 Tax=Klebsiella grimontii TaxID=2058152 RepID=A0A285B017_9ENTR|nr:hypothetical protein [Klebsiella grimontii]SNU34260.1 hypothetical protein KOSB73_220379 [Klebsiella grimontii]